MKEATKTLPSGFFFESIRDAVAQGKTVPIIVTGRSMAPTFVHKVDRIEISPFKAEELAPGDVVMFDRGDTICVHRIISRDADKLVIRGDGNSAKALEYASIGDVIGLVTGGTMRGGRPFKITDRAWARQTDFVFRWFPLLAKWHNLKRIVRSYPLSIVITIVVGYLSFFDPNSKTLPTELIGDKIVHSIMYFGVTVTFWFEWLRVHLSLRRKAMKKGVLFCVLLPVVLGGVIELIQEYVVTYRSGEWLDFVFNTAGVAAATAFSLLFTKPLLHKYYSRKHSVK